jgi:hypothetical protein
MLTLTAIALVLPAAFRAAAGTTAEGLEGLSVSISVVLLKQSRSTGHRYPREGGAQGQCSTPASLDPRFRRDDE